MFSNHLWVVFITICFLFTSSIVVGSNSNEYHRVQSRTWNEAIAMAKSFAARLNLTEKCRMTQGVPYGCEGNIIDVPRLNFNGMCFLDSPSGAGDKVLHSTAFTAGIHIAATWDRDLFYKRGVAIGEEFYGKGVNLVMGPMMNIDRNARHGRNWEGFGADPYLSGENAFAYVQGVQGVQDQGVIATAKHYICNEQETNRFYDTLSHESIADINNIQTYSAYLDDKTIHEIYLWPFASSVAAGIGSVMCSDNRVNGTQACQKDKILNGLLKGELEYPGNVMSDWGSAKNGVQAALGGLDIGMPGDDGHMGIALVPFVQNGTMPESRIDDMVTRIMAPYYLLGQDQGYPQRDLNRNAMGDNYKINRQVAAAGMILLKNTNNILPFNVTSDTIFYVYGEAAGQSDYGLDTGGVEGHGGAFYQGGGSGFVEPTYGVDPLSELIVKARDSYLQIRYVTNQSDYNFINSTFRSRGFDQAKCLIFISAYSSEGFDRKSLHALDNGDQLVQTVASHCTHTIVIVNSVSQLNLEAWIDLPNVMGVIWTGMP
jgi:beta-glucosidase